MALLIIGRSRCPVCGEIISAEDEVYTFPHMFPLTHPAADLSDAAAHRGCVESADFGGQALEELRAFLRSAEQ